jgi:hypothetical protein
MYDYSFYKIKNHADGYSYIGIAQKDDEYYAGVSARIVYHVGRYWDFLMSRSYDPYRKDGTLNELFDETLYGKGPFATRLSCMAAAIAKYGWQNFTVELLARGYMTKPVAHAIENNLMELEQPKSYNQVDNHRPASESEVRLMQEDWTTSQFTLYKGVEMKGFDLSGHSWAAIREKLYTNWETLEDNIYS